MRHGADVKVIMSPKASELISPELFKWATGNPVLVELTGDIEHILLTDENPENIVFLIAPATANTITKLSQGIADNALLTTALAAFGRGIPIIVVPAMHLSLWDNPIVKEAVKKLRMHGIKFVEPIVAEGKAKYPDIGEIVEYVFNVVTPKTLRRKKIVVTAGGTRIYLDKIRFISNPSSGKMGVAMALEAWLRGASVKLVMAKHANPGYTIPRDIEVFTFETFDEAQEKILQCVEGSDILIHAAAVSDFKPTETINSKIESDTSEWIIKLIPTGKIIKRARELNPEMFILAFKAEWGLSDEELCKKTISYLKKGYANAAVANDVSKGIFGADNTEAILIYKKNNYFKNIKLSGSKRYVASKILDELVKEGLI